MLGIYSAWRGLAINVGGQGAAQEIFFGTESRNPDVAQFVIPLELIAGVFFLLIALMFVGLGQVPAWVAIVITGRELAVTGVRAIAASVSPEYGR